jgi:Domain of Unknown Function (DUF930)
MRVWCLTFGLVSTFCVGAQAASANDARFFKSLEKLAPTERLGQLCDYTAMTQIRKDSRNFRPERTVANAGADVTMKNNTIEATSGAFRSRKKWYALTYNCTASPDHMQVISFRYTIGAEIPEEKWAGFGLYN